VLNPDTDKFIRRHKGLDYSSRDDNGRVTPLPFKSGVTGIVDVVEGSPWNTINVKLPNGNIIQYLHASRIDVRDGDTVTSSTVLGLTGRTGADQIHLHVQARNARGNIIDLDCAQT
jgi:murein DD-endopeptidase MepM/ murein hydrolase activator NlpD